MGEQLEREPWLYTSCRSNANIGKEYKRYTGQWPSYCEARDHLSQNAINMTIICNLLCRFQTCKHVKHIRFLLSFACT